LISTESQTQPKENTIMNLQKIVEIRIRRDSRIARAYRAARRRAGDLVPVKAPARPAL
jgi:hypothetical protein